MKKVNYYLSILLLFVAFGCQTDDLEVQPNPSEISLSYVSADDIPDVMDQLGQKLNFSKDTRGSSNSGQALTSIGKINIENIFQVIDTLNNTNYTFLVEKDIRDRSFSFTNLVIKKKEDGTYDSPYLLTYTPGKEALPAFIESGFDMKSFTGTVQKRYVNKVYSGTSNQANLESSSDPYPGDQPCPGEQYSGGSTGGGGTYSDPPNPNNGGGSVLVQRCYTYFEETSPRECINPWEDVPWYDAMYNEYCIETAPAEYIKRTECYYEWVSNSAYEDSECSDPTTEDVGVINDFMSVYIDELAEDLPREFFDLDPEAFWQWMWQNGYVNPYAAGFIDGFRETIGSLYSIYEFYTAWNILELGYGTSRSEFIRLQTKAYVELIVDLALSSDLRAQLWSDLKVEFSNYIDETLSLSSQGMYNQGKLIFDVATLFIGIGEINAILKGQKLSHVLLSSLRKIPQQLDNLGIHLGLRKNPDVLKAISNSAKEGLDGVDAITDAVQISGKSNPSWPEIQALFKRGNDFNRKGKLEYYYNEVHLSDGKRLDSYVPGHEIVSRKATNLSEIQPSTFEAYLKELTTKYKKGKVIRSDKYKTGSGAIDGQTLSGDYYLEIPSSNKNYFEGNQILKDLANQYNVFIKYLDE
tara:strand:- start:1577 stop:3490 length:1914 start_codon:yes stop_codon:yes gene_type:complete